MEKKDAKKQSPRERGASFPYLSLPEAVKIIRDAGSYGKQHSKAAMASYAGHSTANSGPFKQKLSALRDWGFITTPGDSVVLTDAAIAIAYPSDPEGAKNILLDAFRGCGIFWKLYNDSAKGMPLRPDLLANGAVSNYKVAVASKAKFIKSFIESAEAVGLIQRMPNGEVKFTAFSEGDVMPAADDQIESQGGSEANLPTSADANPSGLRPVVSQLWGDESSEIFFEVRSNKPLTAAPFTQIGKAVTTIEELWKTLQEPSSAQATEGNKDEGIKG